MGRTTKLLIGKHLSFSGFPTAHYSCTMRHGFPIAGIPIGGILGCTFTPLSFTLQDFFAKKTLQRPIFRDDILKSGKQGHSTIKMNRPLTENFMIPTLIGQVWIRTFEYCRGYFVNRGDFRRYFSQLGTGTGDKSARKPSPLVFRIRIAQRPRLHSRGLAQTPNEQYVLRYSDQNAD